MKIHLHHSSKIVITKSQNSRNKDSSYYFCLTMEGSGSGSVLLTNGSGRPKTYGSGTLVLVRIYGTGTLTPIIRQVLTCTLIF
jgi:hypothetical protein